MIFCVPLCDGQGGTCFSVELNMGSGIFGEHTLFSISLDDK